MNSRVDNTAPNRGNASAPVTEREQVATVGARESETSIDESNHSLELAVEMEGVSRRFGDFDAVSDVSLTVPAGTILGLIGPSGSGKTTIIKMLTGTLAPTEGKIKVLGEDPGHFHRRTRERIGYMPQASVLYPDLTASENLSFVGSLFGLLWFRRRRRAHQLLKLFDLWDARNRLARALSGGMQRRLSLASALIHEPSLLFVDEPTAGIDPILRQTIWDEFRRLRDQGRTLFVTTQYVGESEYCDEVAILDHGRVVRVGPPDTLRRDAFGGDLVAVTVEDVIDGRTLLDTEGVLDVRQNTPRDLLVVTRNAGEATPAIVDALERGGHPVQSIREHRPSFDDVFVELLEQEKRGDGRTPTERGSAVIHRSTDLPDTSDAEPRVRGKNEEDSPGQRHGEEHPSESELGAKHETREPNPPATRGEAASQTRENESGSGRPSDPSQERAEPR